MVPGPKPRVFLDSNVIFSGLHSAKGAPGIILERFIRGDIRVVVSQQVLREVVLTIKEKLPEALPALSRLLINVPPEVIADPAPDKPGHWAEKISAADAAIVVAAMATQPDYFVTGDAHFIKDSSISKESGLQIVTPAQFVRLMGDERYK